MIRTDDPTRRADLAAIHVGKKNLRLDDETYRALLWTLTGRESSAELNAPQRKAVIERMRALGLQRKPLAHTVTRMNQAQAKKIVAMWIELAKKGIVRDPSDRALNHFIARVTKVSHINWLRPAEANKVIEALKAMAARGAGAEDVDGRGAAH
jgi:phage gp16-like protein